MKCSSLQCLMAPYFARALEKKTEEELNRQHPLSINESIEQRKNNYRNFIRNK